METDVITAVQAQGLAGISYRQLDYWVRKGWVTPSIDPGRGKASRRLFAVDDVVRLGVLCHLGRSRRNLTELGSQVAPLTLGERFVVVDSDDHLTTPADTAELVDMVGEPGVFTVCDVDALRRHVLQATTAADTAHTEVDRPVVSLELRRGA